MGQSGKNCLNVKKIISTQWDFTCVEVRSHLGGMNSFLYKQFNSDEISHSGGMSHIIKTASEVELITRNTFTNWQNCFHLQIAEKPLRKSFVESRFKYALLVWMFCICIGISYNKHQEDFFCKRICIKALSRNQTSLLRLSIAIVTDRIR